MFTKSQSKHSGAGRFLESYANPRRSRGFAQLSRQMELIEITILELKCFSQHAQFRKMGNITRTTPTFNWGIFSHVTGLDQFHASKVR